MATPSEVLAPQVAALRELSPATSPASLFCGRTLVHIASTIYTTEGINTYILALVGRLASRNSGLTQVVCYEHADADCIDDLSVGTSRIRFHSFRIDSPPDLVRVLGHYHSRPDQPLDLIVAHIPFFPEARAAGEFAHRHRIPFLAYNHAGAGSLSADQERVLKETLSGNGRITVLAVSAASRAKICTESGLDVPIEIVGPMIATERFTPVSPGEKDAWAKIKSARENLKSGGKRDLLVLAPNSFIARKLPLDLIHALRALSAVKSLVNLKLGFVGHMDSAESASLLQEAVAYIRQHDLVSRITFSPPADQHLLRYVYGAADIVVLPGFSETFGLVLAEAGLMARPVVGYDVAGVREVVDHTHTGLLAPWHADRDIRVAGLAKAIRQLCLDPGMRSAMGSAGRRRILEKFDPARLIQRHEECYSRAIAGNSA